MRKKCEDLGRLCKAKLLVSDVRLVTDGFGSCSPTRHEGDTREPLFEVSVRRRGKDNTEGEVTLTSSMLRFLFRERATRFSSFQA